jgi:anti-sigma B factor antagonist
MSDWADLYATDQMVKLAVCGEIDMATAPSFAIDADYALDHRTDTTLALNLSRVTFIDAAGISALVAIRNRAHLDDNRLVIIQPARCVLRVLDLTRLADAFTVGRSNRPEA